MLYCQNVSATAFKASKNEARTKRVMYFCFQLDLFLFLFHVLFPRRLGRLTSLVLELAEVVLL
jgi:hypothetical protein